MKTVDLSEKMKEQEEAAKKTVRSSTLSQTKKRVVKKTKAKNSAGEIDKIFSDQAEDLIDDGLQKIDRPKMRIDGSGLIGKAVVFVLFIVIVFFGFSHFSDNQKSEPVAPVATSETGWYAVKLTNDEMYYGQIDDLGSDPVIVKNVYYNYDQLNAGDTSESGRADGKNLRLVKRGEEVHGPDGSLSVVRSQVVYMEPMKEDSKVLQAILRNEE